MSATMVPRILQKNMHPELLGYIWSLICTPLPSDHGIQACQLNKIHRNQSIVGHNNFS